MYSIFKDEAASFVHTSQDLDTNNLERFGINRMKKEKMLVEKSEKRTCKFCKNSEMRRRRRLTESDNSNVINRLVEALCRYFYKFDAWRNLVKPGNFVRTWANHKAKISV